MTDTHAPPRPSAPIPARLGASSQPRALLALVALAILAACAPSAEPPGAATPTPAPPATPATAPAPPGAAAGRGPEEDWLATELGPSWVPDEAIRPEAAGFHGAVVAGHPLAAAAGYEVLRAGGNATDAAVTMAAVLAVVRPHMNGVGGDAWALFFDAETGEVQALNGSGRAAAAADPAFFEDRGLSTMPGSGALSVTVPGAVSAWASALERYGTISLSDALAPAIRLAEEGFVVTATLARDLAGATRLNEAGRALYAPGGTPLAAGDRLRNPALGHALRRIADEGPGAMYGGRVGEALAAFLAAEGSPLTLADLAAHRPEWAQPAHLDVFGYRVHVTPPNSQGIVLLQTLGIAEARGIAARAPYPAAWLHDLIEAKQFAFGDRGRWIADPATDPAPLDRLLDPAYLAARAALIGSVAGGSRESGLDPAGAPPGGDPEAEADGDTVYLMALDADGNAVSWIQSLFSSFGSGLVDPATGIVLQNRGAGFTLAAGHPNRIAGGKRPFHTLMATLVTTPDPVPEFVLAIGTPGGDGQSQTVATGLFHLLVGGLDPQRAVEAPRFRSDTGTAGLIEDRFPADVLEALAARGHALRPTSGWTAPFGNLMVIRRFPDGTIRTGADMRREGAALAW